MQVDVAIIGGGIAGLSCAASIGKRATVCVIEAEPTLGYHATGRSAAVYTECYGSEVIRKLAVASRPYLEAHGLLSDRGLLFVAPPNRAGRIGELHDEFSKIVQNLERLDARRVSDRCELIQPEHTAGGLFEPDAADVDVDGLQNSFLSAARESGHQILSASPVLSLDWTGSEWAISAGEVQVTARVVVNAAGAWADSVAVLAGVDPLGLHPLLRSVFTFDPGRDTDGWPMLVNIDEAWYMKPEGPHMLGSAASEIPREPADVRAPELDVALGIERLNNATTLEIRSVQSTWAGLRTFTTDRAPAVGFSANTPGFFWLVGQGGYGIKTSPALGTMAADLVTHDDPTIRTGIDGDLVSALDPARFRI